MTETTLLRRPAAGVAIDVDLSEKAPIFVVSLLRDDGETDTLARFADEACARTAWTAWACRLRVPRLVARPDGGFRNVDASPQALILRAPASRRRRKVAARRSPARMPLHRSAPAIHRGEREIVSYE